MRRNAQQEAWKLLIVQHPSTLELSTKGQVVRGEFQKDLFRHDCQLGFAYIRNPSHKLGSGRLIIRRNGRTSARQFLSCPR